MVAERLERGVLAGIAIIGTSRPEAEVVLELIDAWTPERLQEVATSIRTSSDARCNAEYTLIGPATPAPDTPHRPIRRG